MISRLPGWVEYGAFVLALLAGFVNSVGLLGFEHQSVSHLSGTATLLGARLLEQPDTSLHLLAVILSFLAGAVISGWVLRSSALQMGRHYGLLLLIEAALLFAACHMLLNGSSAGHYFASAACGLQNALATTYSGAIIRTTHITGIVTDLGIMLGAWLRKQKFDQRRATLYLLIIGGFVVGAMAGAVSYQWAGYNALMMPSGGCLLLALAYHWYQLKTIKK